MSGWWCMPLFLSGWGHAFVIFCVTDILLSLLLFVVVVVVVVVGIVTVRPRMKRELVTVTVGSRPLS